MRNFAGAANKFLGKFQVDIEKKGQQNKRIVAIGLFWITKKKKMTDSTIYHTISRNAVADTSGETLKWARVNLDLTSPGQHKEKCSNFRGGQVVCDIKHCARSGTKWTCEVESNST